MHEPILKYFRKLILNATQFFKHDSKCVLLPKRVVKLNKLFAKNLFLLVTNLIQIFLDRFLQIKECVFFFFVSFNIIVLIITSTGRRFRP